MKSGAIIHKRWRRRRILLSRLSYLKQAESGYEREHPLEFSLSRILVVALHC